MSDLKEKTGQLKSRIRERVAALCKARGITTNRLAGMMGLSRGTLYRLMDDGSWTDVQIELAALVFDVEVMELVAPSRWLERDAAPTELPVTTDSTRRLLEVAELQLVELRKMREAREAREGNDE